MARPRKQYLLVWWTGDPQKETPKRHTEVRNRKRDILSLGAVKRAAGIKVYFYEWWAAGWIERKW